MRLLDDGSIDMANAPAGLTVRAQVAGDVLVDGARPEWVSRTSAETRAGCLVVTGTSAAAVVRTEITYTDDSATFAVSITNSGDEPLVVTSLRPLVLELSAMPTRMEGFTSSWGLEYQPIELDPAQPQQLVVTTGRSSQGASPWVRLSFDDAALVVSPHCSGNWQVTTDPRGDAMRVSAGLSPDELSRVLAPGAATSLPPVTVAFGPTPQAASAGLVRALLVNAPAGPPLLTEWNHWWPYEDQEINEQVFLDNAAIAAELGLEVAVLDAGWFGNSAVDSDWYQERGDWHKVNAERFPNGLAWLADQTRARGVDFGIWIEAEAVGNNAELRDLHPEFMATSSTNGPQSFLGYVCLGSPDAREFIRSSVGHVITTTKARWIKWDFNLDPGLGCDRADHGHLPAEGLLEHYRGLYQVFDELRAEFPDTIFEACSSGGLRIDAGLAEHVDCFFLSDPDWTEHHLACLWGAAQMLPPRQILHWVQSEWRGDHRFQHVDYSGSLLTDARFDLKVQSSMLHRFGVAIRLPEMRTHLRDRLSQHVTVYKEFVRPVLERGVLTPLNGQPLREEKGNRSPAFQVTSGDEHLIGAFRLTLAPGWEPVVPQSLDPEADYRVRVLDIGGGETVRSGAALLSDGIPLPNDSITSTLVHLSRAS